MRIADRLPLMAASWIAALLLNGCGGGGGNGGGGTAGSGSSVAPSSGASPSTTWIKGKFSPSATFAGLCVAPRSGNDPESQMPYPDRQGTALDEKNWLRSWTNDLYLWYDEVVDQDPAGFTSDAGYFAVLKTTATTSSGNPKDRFHFTYATGTWEALLKSDEQLGYGAAFVVIAQTPPRDVVVAYTEPNTEASTAPANLARGTKLLTVDGVDLVNAGDQASVDTLNAGLSPVTVGESHTFSILDPGATTPRTVTLVSANFTSTPVQNVRTLSTTGADLVGYLLFNDQLESAESELVAAFAQLQRAGVRDLVLDIRYNGGGLLDIASEVAYMIAGPSATTGKTFELNQFNNKYPTTSPVTGDPITPLGFHSDTQGFSVTSGQALPTLNLSRVFVLTGTSTCSASESIINGLRGVNVVVIQIGSTTCGKPYGFYPADNCGTTYFSIELQGVNAQGFGDYPDGFTPENSVNPTGVLVPGCSVADDFTHALGDDNEGVLASALSYSATGACPVAPDGSAAPAQLTGTYVPPRAAGKAIKPFWRENRLQAVPASRSPGAR